MMGCEVERRKVVGHFAGIYINKSILSRDLDRSAIASENEGKSNDQKDETFVKVIVGTIHCTCNSVFCWMSKILTGSLCHHVYLCLSSLAEYRLPSDGVPEETRNRRRT
jgi:hypothetical protein